MDVLLRLLIKREGGSDKDNRTCWVEERGLNKLVGLGEASCSTHRGRAIRKQEETLQQFKDAAF